MSALKSQKKESAQRKPGRVKSKALDNSFESVAARLECDPDLKKFDAKLKKIAKAKPKSNGRTSKR